MLARSGFLEDCLAWPRCNGSLLLCLHAVASKVSCGRRPRETPTAVLARSELQQSVLARSATVDPEAA